jgi:hypothetical protein
MTSCIQAEAGKVGRRFFANDGRGRAATLSAMSECSGAAKIHGANI